MEMSHGSKEFTSIIENAEADLRKLLKVPDEYKVQYPLLYSEHSGIPLSMSGKTSLLYSVSDILVSLIHFVSPIAVKTHIW